MQRLVPAECQLTATTTYYLIHADLSEIKWKQKEILACCTIEAKMPWIALIFNLCAWEHNHRLHQTCQSDKDNDVATTIQNMTYKMWGGVCQPGRKPGYCGNRVIPATCTWWLCCSRQRKQHQWDFKHASSVSSMWIFTPAAVVRSHRIHMSEKMKICQRIILRRKCMWPPYGSLFGGILFCYT